MFLVIRLIRLIFVTMTANTLSSLTDGADRFRPGKQPLLLIGVFSHCHPPNNYYNHNKSNEMNNSSFDESGVVCKKSMQWINSHQRDFVKGYHDYLKVNRLKISPNQIWDLADIEFVSYEVCSMDQATLVAVEILLNASYFVRNETTADSMYPTWNEVDIRTWNRTRRVLAVALFTENDITSVLMNIFSFTSIHIYNMNPSWTLPSYLFVYDIRNIVTTFYLFAETWKTIEDNVLTRQRVARFTIVYLETHVYQYRGLFEYMTERIGENPQYCYNITKLNIQNSVHINRTLWLLFAVSSTEYVFLFGTPSDQVTFFNRAVDAGIKDKIWIMQEVKGNSGIRHIPNATSIITISAPKLADVLHLETLPYHEELKKSLELELGVSPLPVNLLKAMEICCRQTEYFLIAYMLIVEKELTLSNPYPNYVCEDAERTRMDIHCFLNRYHFHVKSVFAYKVKYLLRKFGDKFLVVYDGKYWYKKWYYLCRIPLCQSGFEDVYGEIPQRKWNISIGPYCRKCPLNYFKSIAGSGRCIVCPPLMFSTADGKSCYDPYVLKYNGIDDLLVAVNTILAGIGGGFCVWVLAVFVKFKDTPLVRCADFRTSVVHLLLILLCFLTYPPLFFSRPITIVCYLRPFVVCFVQASSSAVILVKSNRILTIFKSKLRITSEDIRKMYALQVTTVILLNIAGVALAIVAAVFKKPAIVLTVVHGSYEKYLSCNTGAHLHTLVFYFLMLQNLPAVQAFRGRNIPGPFNEAMSIVYATFTTVVFYSSMIPVYYFQPLESRKTLVQCSGLMCTNFVQVLVLYGKRTFVIVFERRKNSKAYVRSKVENETLKNLGRSGHG